MPYPVTLNDLVKCSLFNDIKHRAASLQSWASCNLSW